MKMAELRIGDEIYFAPIHDSLGHKARVKVIELHPEANQAIVEFLDPFENIYLNKNIGDLHDPSPGHLQPG